MELDEESRMTHLLPCPRCGVRRMLPRWLMCHLCAMERLATAMDHSRQQHAARRIQIAAKYTTD